MKFMMPPKQRIMDRLELRFIDYGRVLYSPFIILMASGRINDESFGNYHAQESHCIAAYVDVFGDAEDIVTSTEVKNAFYYLRNSCLQELNDLHRSILPSEATRHYIEFLRDISSTEIAASIVASILPALRIHQAMACMVKKEVKRSETDYEDYVIQDWIDSYSSQGYDEYIEQVENLLRILMTRLTEKELQLLLDIYEQATEFVVELICGVIMTVPTPVPLIQTHPDLRFFYGCDLYSNTKDQWQSDFLSSCRIITDGAPPIMTSVSRYLSDQYTKAINYITPLFRVSFSPVYVQERLEQLSLLEKNAKDNIIESRLLEGLQKDSVERFGAGFSLRHHACLDLFRVLAKNASVLSSSWCAGHMLDGPFKSGGQNLEEVQLYANRLCFCEGKCTGTFGRQVDSAINKAHIVGENMNTSSSRQSLTVFTSESVGDLLCMTQANIAVMINPGSTLLTVGTQCGIKFVPLFSGVVRNFRYSRGVWEPHTGIVYTVTGWEELYSFIVGGRRQRSRAHDTAEHKTKGELSLGSVEFGVTSSARVDTEKTTTEPPEKQVSTKLSMSSFLRSMPKPLYSTTVPPEKEVLNVLPSLPSSEKEDDKQEDDEGSKDPGEGSKQEPDKTE